MQTFTMQFPVTSKVSVDDNGVITITPATITPTPTPSAVEPALVPEHADDGFRQPANVRVHGGDMTFVTSPTGGAGGTMGRRVDTPLMMEPTRVGGCILSTELAESISATHASAPTGSVGADTGLKQSPVDKLLEWIGENTTTNVSTELSANELRYKFGRGFEILEDVMVVSRIGVVEWTPTPTAEVPASSRIAVVYRDRVEGVTYVAQYSTVLRSNVKYLADALRGGKYSIKTLSKILQTSGKHTGCPSHCAVPKHLKEDVKYQPLRDYLASLDIADVDSTTYSPMTIKTVVGRKYNGVEGLSILTSKGVCPWMDVTPNDATRIALLYLCAESKIMYVAHYLSATTGQYRDCVAAVESVVQPATT